ncbi:MAG: hypothetical protein ACXW3Z_11840, partial [Limisphaerales bacterium]
MAASPIRARALVLLGCLWFAATSVSRSQGWEQTVNPLVPTPFAELRPLRVQYNFGWSGFAAATAKIRAAKLPNGSVQFDATGGTIGLARALWVYDVRHTALSDGQTFRPITVSEVE